MYVLSLANRLLRTLDRRQKATVRSAVQIFFYIEMGFYNASQQAQLGSYIQMGPSQNSDNQNMYWSNQSLSSSNSPFNTQIH